MTTEQKAKAYDEVQNKLRRFMAYGVDPLITRADVQDFFPELRESEDERIRKDIVFYIAANHKDDGEKARWLYWLEKQGKTSPILSNSTNIGNVEKSADKIEPKFKFGDWVVVNDGRIGRISECTKDFADVDLEFSCLSTSPNNIRSWTIQDAKDGDVLATEDWVFIFKKINSNEKPVCYCHYDIELGFHIDTNSYIASGSEIYPATKEQHDLLFQKMKDAGYTFDFEKKELKKVEPQPTEDRYMEGYLNGTNDALKTLKPAAWSEEDRETIDYLIDYLESELDSSYTKEDKEEFTKEIELLKSLRPQNRWKPSDEQMEYLAKAITTLGDEGDCKTASILNDLRVELKKLR